ncbi:hypothetical protein BDZ89DRAFT_1058868 [Hymenopellis radicata]|nr:hypothetical protein BDZ89DRAFT_1058868 [Hymenopellis radicata]
MAMDGDEEHSVLEVDSDGEEEQEYEDDDVSSDLSIPNESIDFDLVYAFHSFAATVEGQANVVKGDSLFLMDDSNSYWWLVRVLKTQEVGYIPAENIETPFERLARLNKHRNVDLAKATEAEHMERPPIAGRKNMGSRTGSNQSHSPNSRTRSQQTRSVIFNTNFYVNRYPPAIWFEEDLVDEDAEWDDTPYEYEDLDLVEEQNGLSRVDESAPKMAMEPDDGMDWDDSAVEDMRTQKQQQARNTDMLTAPQTSPDRASPPSPKQIDPAEVTETRKLTVTPNIAREDDPVSKPRNTTAPLLPSAILQQRQQEEEKKRLRDEEEEAARKKARGKMPAPVSSPTSATDDDGKKKKGGMLSSIFGRKKDKAGSKDKINVANGSIDLGDVRGSGESSRSNGTVRPGVEGMSPTTNIAIQQQQQQQERNSTDPKRAPDPGSPPQVSQLRQRDQQQQALYQQYLNRSPSSASEAQPSYGLQSASAVMPERSVYHSPTGSISGLGPPTSRPRPGSLILSASSSDGQSVSVPDLSVIRVFAGDNVETDATFKTVLLNSSTTSHDLVRQALQRFRLPAGEEASDYYLTVKQIEGSSARLRDEEHPLVVFEGLVEAAMELPKVKRSSMGSISSISSNLSMHPAIKKLPMNDFTDDSAVKFYLNRHGSGDNDSFEGEVDETLIAADVSGDLDVSPMKNQYLSVSTAGNVPPERFSSPSFRFALQLVIYPGDLPEDMVFDTLTEAIVFKETLKGRSNSGSISSAISQDSRRKVFIFPKNVTVAEVIEQGLERFGISEGVVDGGDEVEDKNVKRRSLARVRYGLAVSVNGQERELGPSSKVLDAFPRPPAFRNVDRRSLDAKRRSIDSAQLLGTLDDVSEDDPVFILRRAISYRNSTSRHRMSAPLDEIALRNMHRESASSQGSEGPASAPEAPKPQTHREIIEAQRQAKRENQRAILSAQTNSLRGLDVLLPGNAMLRSARPNVNDDRMRYSYVDTDGETYDISDIVEEEWRSEEGGDLLEGLNKDGGATLHRVLSKIKKGPKTPSLRSSSPSSQYSVEDRSRSVTPGSAGLQSRLPGAMGRTSPQGRTSPVYSGSRPGTTTPTGKPSTGMSNSRRQPSIQSVMSDLSGYVTAPTPTGHSRSPDSGGSSDYHRRTATSPSLPSHPHSRNNTPHTHNASSRKRPFLPKDDFGVARMIGVIEYRASKGQSARRMEPLDPVDELLFGRKVDTMIGGLHPKIREVYEGAFKEIDEAERYLDEMLINIRSGEKDRERQLQGSR